jgi:hypothetical protein
MPTLTEDDADVVPTPTGFGIVVLDPSGLCASPCPFHNVFSFGTITGLQPNTEYVVALFRYGLTINGQLDAGLVARRQAVDVADELVAVGGAPGGDPTVPIESFPTIVPLVDDANPMVLGNFTTDGDGAGAFDVVLDGTGTLYTDISADPPDAAFDDSSLVARNDDTQTVIPRYNYIVILEGPAVDAADAADNPQAMRLQMAQDFEASTGEPINNAYAPFPLEMTDPELVAAPGGAGRPDSITVEFRNLEALAGGAQWRAWLVNRAEMPPTMSPANATYERVAIIREINDITGEIESETDSVLETIPDQPGFVGQLRATVPQQPTPQEVKHRLIVSDATTGGGDGAVGFFTDLVLTPEPSGASMPSNRMAVWCEYTDQAGTPQNFFDDVTAACSLNFGHFDPADASATRTFTSADFIQSAGFGGVLDSRTGTVNEVSVDLRNLPLPPQGFYYEGWLVHQNGNATSMGPITAALPDTTSLFDADIDQDLPGVTATGIRFSNARVVLGDPGLVTNGTANFTTFMLTLEPKLGAATKNVTDLESGPLPITRVIERLP